MFDVLIVGAGLFGATLAYLLRNNGKKVIVVEKEDEVGGMVRTETIRGIEVHKYGAHIFRTNLDGIWDFVNDIQPFEPFINSPITISKGEVFNLPFNMNTFARLWNIKFPDEAKAIISRQIQSVKLPEEIKNLEDYAISQVGTDIYYRFIKGYTEKQWGKPCNRLPKSIMNRIPIRFTYDNNYYNAKYQGIPKYGYTKLIKRLLDGIEVYVGVDGKKFIQDNPSIAKRVVYTGSIDEYYDYRNGKLKYRSLEFKHCTLPVSNYQGNAVVNYADAEVPYTRTIEHSHFIKDHKTNWTILTFEYPVPYDDEHKPFYPVKGVDTAMQYNSYIKYAKADNIIFAGRLGGYAYTDMEDTIKNAIVLSRKLLKEDEE